MLENHLLLISFEAILFVILVAWMRKRVNQTYETLYNSIKNQTTLLNQQSQDKRCLGDNISSASTNKLPPTLPG